MTFRPDTSVTLGMPKWRRGGCYTRQVKDSLLTALVLGSAACTFDTSTVATGFLDDADPGSPTDGATNDSVPGAADAALIDGATSFDAAPPGCQDFGAFNSTTLVSQVNSNATDNAPTLSADELTMIFHSNRSGGQGNRDLWLARRTSIDQPFTAPVNMTQVNTSADELGPTLSGDGLVLYFGTNRSGGLGDYDVWKATRASTGDFFSAPVALPSINSSTIDYFPFVTADGLSLYFASTRAGGVGNRDTWVSTRATTTSEFPAPTLLAATNSTADDVAMTLSADGLSFFIQSDRAGASGGPDVWLATRQSTAQPFSTPSNLSGVNSTSQDQATWLSLDGLRLYQASDRGTSWQIYLTERTCAD